jgi:WD40 repeat protein
MRTSNNLQATLCLVTALAVCALSAFAQGRPDIVWMAGGHGSSVGSVGFSPDGALLASGSLDGDVKLWQVSDGEELRTLTGHAGPVWSVAFSPDGALLASGHSDGTIRLWQVSDGVLVRTLEGHSEQVWSVAFSRDGSLLASGGCYDDRTIMLWWVSDGCLLHSYDQETGTGVSSIQFSPDGRRFGYGRLDGTVVVARNPFAASAATIRGQVNLTDFSGHQSNIPVIIEIRPPGSTQPEEAHVVRLDEQGNYLFGTNLTGDYDVSAKASHWLRQTVPQVSITGETTVNFTLLNGDIDGDNEVTLFDFGRLVAAFGSMPGDSNWNPDADLDGDDEVTLFDFGILVRNFGLMGDE